MMFVSPLEQFDLVFLFRFLGKDIGHSYLIFGICFLFFFFLVIFIRFVFFALTIFRLFEVFYLMFIELLVQQAGRNGIQYFSYIYTVFLMILFSNLLGMLPFGFTVTAHLIITFFLAFFFNCFFMYMCVYDHGISFFYIFIPKNTPYLLLPLVIIIEVVSYLIRTFSLSIRLFANMMAGHCLLFVISSFIFSLLVFSKMMSFVIISIYVCIFLLEFGIAFLQSYVFTILLCIYLKDMVEPSGH